MYQRTETYGWQDLVGFFGGIIGLCVGFSLLSGAELIYFFTLRLFLDTRKEKQKDNNDDDETGSTITDKEILSDSFDAVFSINNSVVDVKAEETKDVKLQLPKPDLVPDIKPKGKIFFLF